MTIKEELKEKLEQVKKSQSSDNQAIEEEAQKMIDEFIIPKFREIASKQPTADYLEIALYDMLLGWNYTTNIDYKKKVSYSREAIYTAAEIAVKYDIKVIDCRDEYLPNIKFILDLR